MWQTAAKALGKIKKDKSLTLIFFYFFAGINKPSKLPTTAGKNQATPASYKGKAWTCVCHTSGPICPPDDLPVFPAALISGASITSPFEVRNCVRGGE